MKLFTKEVDDKLFKQYPLGADLEKQQVVAKIFNPMGRGTWYLLNSDPEDPDYIWGIVDLFETEIGSISRSELESIKIKPFGLGLERDLSFTPINAAELYKGLRSGKQYESGGGLDDSSDENVGGGGGFDKDGNAYGFENNESVFEEFSRGAKVLLEGRTITQVDYLPHDISSKYNMSYPPISFLLDNGMRVFPVIDTEGHSDGGSLYVKGTGAELHVIPPKGEEYGRGGSLYLYKLSRPGGSEDLKDQLMSAKNIPQLKERIKEKYGSLEGVSAGRMSAKSGAFYGVKLEEGGAIGTGKNGFVAFYKGKRAEVMANSAYEAQQTAQKYFKAKHGWDVNVILAEIDGVQVVHDTMFEKGGMIFTDKRDNTIYTVGKSTKGKWTVFSENKGKWPKRDEFPEGFHDQDDAILVAKELAGLTPEFAKGGDLGVEVALWKVNLKSKPILLKKGTRRAINLFYNKNKSTLNDGSSGIEVWPGDATTEEIERHVRSFGNNQQQYAGGGGVGSRVQHRFTKFTSDKPNARAIYATKDAVYLQFNGTVNEKGYLVDTGVNKVYRKRSGGEEIARLKKNKNYKVVSEKMSDTNPDLIENIVFEDIEFGHKTGIEFTLDDLYAKGGKVESTYAILYSPAGIISDIKVFSRDEKEARTLFENVGIKIPADASIRFSTNVPYYE